MCDHHDGGFKEKFPSCMSRILASYGINDAHTVTNMIHYQFPFLIGTQSTCDIECDQRIAKNREAQAFDVWMSRNPSGRAFYCDLTDGHIGDDSVVNEAEPLFVEYCNLTVKDGHMVEDGTVAESVLTFIPEHLTLLFDNVTCSHD